VAAPVKPISGKRFARTGLRARIVGVINGGGGNWFQRPLLRDPLLWCSVFAGVVVDFVGAGSAHHHRASITSAAGFYAAAIAAVVLVSCRALRRGFREPLRSTERRRAGSPDPALPEGDR
jgi:hypothetical protein